MEINIREAKTNFSKLLLRVAAGEEVTITKAGVPVARLVPVMPKTGKRKLGLYSGKIWMADDFDAPLPDDILAGFLETKRRPKRTRKRILSVQAKQI
jgi:prevent-host-death family protein